MIGHEKAAGASKAKDEGVILLSEAPARTFPSVRGWRSARSSHRQPEGGPPCLTCTLIYPGLIPSR